MYSLRNPSGLISWIILSAFFLVSYFPGGNSITKDQLALLEDVLLNRTLEAQYVTGLSISIVEGDNFDQVFSRGYGFRDVDKRLPATNETLFGVGSLSKVSGIFLLIFSFCKNFYNMRILRLQLLHLPGL